MTFKETLHSLHRSTHDRILGGVCAGFAETTDTPAWVWRASFVLMAAFAGGGVLVYLILWLLMPETNDIR